MMSKKQLLSNVLADEWLTMGAKVNEFEVMLILDNVLNVGCFECNSWPPFNFNGYWD